MLKVEILSLLIGLVVLVGVLILAKTLRLPKSYYENHEKLKEVRRKIRKQDRDLDL